MHLELLRQWIQQHREALDCLERMLEREMQTADRKTTTGRNTTTTKSDITATAEGPTTVAGACEALLQERGTMHIDTIQIELKHRFGIDVTRKNLANILNRWIWRGAKFERPKPLTYGLIRSKGTSRGI